MYEAEVLGGTYLYFSLQVIKATENFCVTPNIFYVALPCLYIALGDHVLVERLTVVPFCFSQSTTCFISSAPGISAREHFWNLGPFFVSTCYLPKHTFPSLVHIIPSLLGIFSHVNKLLFSYFQASGKSSHSGKACLLGRAGSFGSEVL